MDKKAKKKLEALKKKLDSLRRQLAGAKKQTDDPDEVERLSGEIATAEAEIQKIRDA
ncbi:MAG: hypothetical protein AAF517_25955 [Planctomycetota bacterium]